MANWKQNIDRQYEIAHAKQEAKDRKQNLIAAEKQKCWEQKVKREIECIDQRLFKEWQKRFTCSLCKTVPTNPLIRTTRWEESMVDGDYDVEVDCEPYTDFDYSPEGYATCSRCRKWVCSDCLYRGICAKCAR